MVLGSSLLHMPQFLLHNRQVLEHLGRLAHYPSFKDVVYTVARVKGTVQTMRFTSGTNRSRLDLAMWDRRLLKGLHGEASTLSPLP